MNVTVNDLDKILQKWGKNKKPTWPDDKVWELVEKPCRKIKDMISISRTDKQTTSMLGEGLGKITLSCFLLCYYIGYELASGGIASGDSSAYLMAATTPIDEFIGVLLGILVTNGVTTMEDGSKWVLDVATLIGKAANDVCILGIYDYSREHRNVIKDDKLSPLSNTPPLSFRAPAKKPIHRYRTSTSQQSSVLWGCGNRIIIYVIFLIGAGIIYLFSLAWTGISNWFASPQPTSVSYVSFPSPQPIPKPLPTIFPTFTIIPRNYRPITWMELQSFLSDDHTNWSDYDPTYYVCLDFSVDLVENATKKNIKAWVVGVSFSDNETDHAFVAFETTDYGVVYIEPQGDNPYWGLGVGKRLCDSWGKYACMGTVVSIDYLQCDHAQNCTRYYP